MKNQEVIDAFDRAARSLGEQGLALMGRAGLLLSSLIEPPPGRRDETYTGAPLDTLPNLTPAERAALRAAVGAHVVGSGSAPAGPFVVWEHHAEPGLHGPADPGGGWTSDAFEVVQQSKVRAVKVLVPDVRAGEVERLRHLNPAIPEMFIVARLFSGQLGERRPQGGSGTPEAAGHWFADEVANERDRTNPMRRAIGSGITYFEVHNEPNTPKEGLLANWQDGEQFARFFQTVVNDVRPRFPDVPLQFGFPGLSPGFVGPERPIGVDDFLRQAHAAVELADFVACHIYWGHEGVDRAGAIEQLRQFCARFPNKKILCTEFSNNNADVERPQKALEYAQFYHDCRGLPANLGAAFAYVLSWRDDKNKEGFLQLNHDGSFSMTPMAEILGREAF